MPTYLYETIPQDGQDVVEQFEVRQHFNDAPLSVHPETGAPVRRVISGGLGTILKSASDAAPEVAPGCGPESCRCGRFA